MKLVEFSSFTWIFILSFTSVVRTLVQGQSQMIGPPQPIVTAPGSDVILPCHLEPPLDVQKLTVEWSRTDQKPDPSDRLSQVKYVHVYRDRREFPNMKIPSYARRTTLFYDGLKQGNISLKIMNVRSADEGRYRCFIPNLNSRVKSSVVQLVVDPNLFNSPTTATPPDHRDFPENPEDTMDKEKLQTPLVLITTVVAVVVLTSVVGVAVYFIKRRQPHDVNYEAAPKEPATCLLQV